jgi:hypothetical protein
VELVGYLFWFMFWIQIIPVSNYTASETGYVSFIWLQAKVKCTTVMGPVIYLVSHRGNVAVLTNLGSGQSFSHKNSFRVHHSKKSLKHRS